MSPVFEIVFLIVMAGFPLGFLVFALRGDTLVPGADDPSELRDRIQPVVRRLTLVTVTTMAITGLIAALVPTPGPVLLVGGVCGFHLGWWRFVFPLLNHGRAASGASHPGGATDDSDTTGQSPRRRVASLRVRPRSAYLAPAWWALPIGLFTLGLGELVRAGVTGPARSQGVTLQLVMMPIFALAALVGYGWWAHHSAGTPRT